jgi:hypothetical protein
MRPGELYFLLVPSPLGLGALFTQHDWLAATLVVAVLMALGILVRFANVLIGEVKEKGYYEQRERREEFLDSQAVHEQKRRRIKLEGEQQRRDLKRRSSSWWDQLRLFR